MVRLHIVLFAAAIVCLQGCFATFSCKAEEPVVFTCRVPESKNDLRYEYDTKLLKLALDSTVETDGPYELAAGPIMNYSRAHEHLQGNTLENFVIKLSYEPRFEELGLAFVPFPVDLGIVGYRVCFAHPEVVKKIKMVDTIDALRKFTHGQGLGWSDVKILRHNGFEVVEVPTYESLFSMVTARRFDLFCRGANELFDEYREHPKLVNLSYDKSVALFYPLPRFFYMNKANTQALDRINRGLQIAYQNGTLRQLWQEEYGKSVSFVKLSQRKVFKLENPLVRDLDVPYEQYFYNVNESK